MIYHFPAFQIFCPYASLLVILPELYWDNLFDYPFLWAAIAVHLGTTIFAAVTAHRLRFHKYHLKGAGSAPGAFFGCLFFWLAGFPLFLSNRHRIANGTAPLRKASDRRHTGFFHETLIWAVLWAILFGVAFPSIITSRHRLEQGFAIRMLKRYARAQSIFKTENIASVPGNTKNKSGFCDNFRNLYYGKDRSGKRAGLLYKDVADAYAGPAMGMPTPAPHADIPKAFKGFCYLEDPYVAANALWETEFGLVAYPQTKRPHDYQLFWIGRDGRVLTCRYESGRLNLLTADQSPLHPEGQKYWRTYTNERSARIDDPIPMRPSHEQTR